MFNTVASSNNAKAPALTKEGIFKQEDKSDDDSLLLGKIVTKETGRYKNAPDLLSTSEKFDNGKRNLDTINNHKTELVNRNIHENESSNELLLTTPEDSNTINDSHKSNQGQDFKKNDLGAQKSRSNSVHTTHEVATQTDKLCDFTSLNTATIQQCLCCALANSSNKERIMLVSDYEYQKLSFYNNMSSFCLGMFMYLMAGVFL